MQLFIAILWYILVFLAGPELINNKKEAAQEQKAVTESVQNIQVKQSKVIVWEDDNELNPVGN